MDAGSQTAPASRTVEQCRPLVSLRKSMTAQLAEVGYQPADITYLALSHYHWDHAANANAFASATWLVRKVERDAMFPQPAAEPPQPSNFAALGRSKTTLITDDYDVFGDGTVVIKVCRSYAGPQRTLREACEDRRRSAVRRPLSLSRGAHTQSSAYSRLRPGTDARSRAALEDFSRRPARSCGSSTTAGEPEIRKAPAFYE